MVDEDNSEIEVWSPEDDTTSYYGEKDAVFNHQAHINQSYLNIIASLSEEMCEGFWQEKTDEKGNSTLIHFPDNRKKAIECIRTLKNLVTPDIEGTDYMKKVNVLVTEGDELLDKMIQKQKSWWCGLNQGEKKDDKAYHPYVMMETLYPQGVFFQEYMLNLVDIYREIFVEIGRAVAHHTKYFRREEVYG